MKTIRMQCLDWLIGRMEAFGPPDLIADPTAFPYTFKFGVVGLGSLGDVDNRKRNAVGIVPGAEVKEPKFPLTQNTLPVAIEFRRLVNQGDNDPGEEVEDILGQLQHYLGEDNKMGGLAVDFVETGCEIDLDSYTDKTVQGVIFMEMRYRHRIGDPYTPV